MSVTIQQLNGDASFLLTFRPSSYVSSGGECEESNAFHIILDPWLAPSPSHIMHRKFASSRQKTAPYVSSMQQLPTPDLVLISQNMTDHCHKETLQQLPSHLSRTQILAPKDAADTIKGWKYFNNDRVVPLRKWSYERQDRMHRIKVPGHDPSYNNGEVTVAYLEDKWNRNNMAKTHTAICITYTPPSNHPLNNGASYPGVLTPPHTPLSPCFSDSQDTITSINGPISIIFSPHGCKYSTLAPYVEHHLVPLSAVPLTALLHCFDKVKNTWYLGGKVCNGMQSGVEIALRLQPRVWISAHDGDKEVSGASVKRLKVIKPRQDEVEAIVSPTTDTFPKEDITRALILDVGEKITLFG